MQLITQKGLEVARELYASHGYDWQRVIEAGRRRPDGIIEVSRDPEPAGSNGCSSGSETQPRR